MKKQSKKNIIVEPIPTHRLVMADLLTDISISSLGTIPLTSKQKTNKFQNEYGEKKFIKP